MSQQDDVVAEEAGRDDEAGDREAGAGEADSRRGLTQARLRNIQPMGPGPSAWTITMTST